MDSARSGGTPHRGPVLTDAQRLDWLRLIRSENIGPRTFRALVNRFGGAGAALAALPEVARSTGRILRICTIAEAEREFAMARAAGIRFVAMGEPDYPAALQAIDTAPPVLAVRGEGAILHRPAVAIVGSRNASAIGLTFAARLARELGEAGYAVVSGLARGIDTACHRASLESGTIAVLAGGHDNVYPPQNRPLLESLLGTGAAVSETPLTWEARGRDFPRRNRIVSGLSLGTIVVEAARKSGSLITARFALEQGREVFAVPGSPLDPRADGTNDLIRQGATLCASARHVIDALAPLLAGTTEPRFEGFESEGRHDEDEPLWDELPFAGVAPAPQAPVRGAAFGNGFGEPAGGPETDASRPEVETGPANQPPLSHTPSPNDENGSASPARRIHDLLGTTPIAIDDLARLGQISIREVNLILMDLELAGRLNRHGGNTVSLISARSDLTDISR
jgi:DNA processing protein